MIFDIDSLIELAKEDQIINISYYCDELIFHGPNYMYFMIKEKSDYLFFKTYKLKITHKDTHYTYNEIDQRKLKNLRKMLINKLNKEITSQHQEISKNLSKQTTMALQAHYNNKVAALDKILNDYDTERYAR